MRKTRSQWCIYLLECSNGKLYTGMTNNLERRMKMHAAGTGARFTRAFGVKRLRYTEPCRSRSAALKREARIKKMTRKEKLVLCRAGGARCRSKL